MHKLRLLAKHEAGLLAGSVGRLLQIIMFYMIIVTLYVFSVGVDSEHFQLAGVGILWIGAFLAMQLSVPSMLQQDYDDGTLELYWLHAYMTEAIVLVKVLVYWIVLGGLVVLFCPLLILFLQLSVASISTIALSLGVGVLGLLSLNVVGAALTLGARHVGLLQPLIILPLTVPLLVFGVAASKGDIQALYTLLGLAVMYVIMAVIAGAMTLMIVIREG